MNHSREEELEMMQSPDRWPAWPQLPLKKPQWQVGVIVELDRVRPIVFIGNMFDPKPFRDRPIVEYETFEQLYDDGWRVD